MTAEVPAAHGVGNVSQIVYPGGKDGWWLVECVCGKYRSKNAVQGTAVDRVERHARDKARAK